MAYIGKPPVNGFHTKQSLTGDNSTTSFALSFTVADPSSLIVSVGGVLQEPGVAYSLSGGGTNIVFSAAPSSTDTVYVHYLGTAIVQNLLDINGSEFILDLDGDTTLTADTDDQIDIKIAGADDFQFTANTFTALAGSSVVIPESGLTLGSTAVTSTAAELNLIDGGTSRGTTSVATGDGLLVNDGGTMRMTNVDTVSTYFSSHNVGGGNIVTTGALDSGSITSNFGTINTGSSAISSTGTITYGTLNDGTTAMTTTTAELNLIDGGTARGTDALASGDGILINDGGTMKMTNVDTVQTFMQTGITTDLSGDSTPQLGGFLDANGNYMQTEKGGDIASASPTVIDTDGDYFDVTGTTGFSAFTVAADRQFTLQFDGVLTMTHHATNLDLPGEANITTAAGDVATFQSTAANQVQCINYTRADGTAIVGASLDGAVVINESGADVDFRVETNTNANALVVDGGENKVGLGMTPAHSNLDIYTAGDASTNVDHITFKTDYGNGGKHSLSWRDSTDTVARISAEYESASDGTVDITFNSQFDDGYKADTVETLRITGDGRGESKFTAAAWVKYNQSSDGIEGSHNISSVTDTSAGSHHVNFDVNMASGSYCIGHSNNVSYSFLDVSTNTTTMLVGSFNGQHRENNIIRDTAQNSYVVFI